MGEALPLHRAHDASNDCTSRPRYPVLAITDSLASLLARNSSLFFEVRDVEVHRFRPLVPPNVLAQTLIIAPGYYRDARLARAASEAVTR